jgi:hypothetical protein
VAHDGVVAPRDTKANRSQSHRQSDWIDTWHFTIDDASGDRHGRARSRSEERETPVVGGLRLLQGSSLRTVDVSPEELLEIRRELQRSANAVQHAIDRIDSLLEVRRSA